MNFAQSAKKRCLDYLARRIKKSKSRLGVGNPNAKSKEIVLILTRACPWSTKFRTKFFTKWKDSHFDV